MDSRKIKPIVLFLKRVQKKYQPEKIILFGSQAKGHPRAGSDYDIIVVSPRFKKIQFYERMVQLYHLKRGVSVPMDLIGLTPEEFKEKKQRKGVIQEAVREGIELAVS
ncbi:MAG: nucleotidyltransferase domain-containing protein [Nanoarchaeota archaeon]|nr:nucleotidyltransferase domain-containing protein [Nanoarchaeota archaeon]